MSPVVDIKSLAARAAATSEAAPLNLPGSPAFATALISISIILLAATILILYRIWRSHSKGRAMKPSFDEFELTRKPYGRNENGRTPLSGTMFTQVMHISRTRPSTRTHSVIDISPEGALKLGLARHSTPPLLKTASISSIPTFVQIGGSSNSHPPISHHRAMSRDSLAPPIAGVVEKPLPPEPTQVGSSYPLRTLQLPDALTRPGPFSPGGLSSHGSSSSRSRSGSEASLFSFIQNRESSFRAENEDISIPPPVHIPAAAAAGYVGHRLGGQVAAGNKLHDDDQMSKTHPYNTESIPPIIHSVQDARQTLPPPWFEPNASTSRTRQGNFEIPSRIPNRRLAIATPEPLITTRRYSSVPLCRTPSTATALMTPPPPPYTPLDTNFEVPPLPQKARLRSSQRLISSTTPSPGSPISGHPTTRIPVFTPYINDSKAALRSHLNQQQACSNEHGTLRLSRPRSNSLPLQNTSVLSGSISARGQPRTGPLMPLHLNTGTGVTGRAWLPGTIDEIISTTPSRGTFTIDE